MNKKIFKTVVVALCGFAMVGGGGSLNVLPAVHAAVTPATVTPCRFACILGDSCINGTCVPTPQILPDATSSPTSTPIIPSVSDTPAVQIFTQRLAVRSTGPQVYLLQLVLMKDGDFLNAVISGRFGSLTEAALKVFQAKYGIVSSGTAYTTGYGATGAKTNAKLNALLASGMLGN